MERGDLEGVACTHLEWGRLIQGRETTHTRTDSTGTDQIVLVSRVQPSSYQVGKRKPGHQQSPMVFSPEQNRD